MLARLRRSSRDQLARPSNLTAPAKEPPAPPRRRLPRRLLVLLATRPLAYWSLTTIVAAALGVVMYGVAASAAQTRSRFGALVPALVATRAIAPGEVLDEHDTEIRVL